MSKYYLIWSVKNGLGWRDCWEVHDTFEDVYYAKEELLKQKGIKDLHITYLAEQIEPVNYTDCLSCRNCLYRNNCPLGHLGDLGICELYKEDHEWKKEDIVSDEKILEGFQKTDLSNILNEEKEDE